MSPAIEPWVDVTLTRRPILDRDLRLHAYEVRYRDLPSRPPEEHGLSSAGLLVDGLFGIGRVRLSDGRPTFVPVGLPLLLSGALLALPPDDLVIELPPMGHISPAIVDAVAGLRGHGLRVALLDVLPGDPRLQLIGLVDVLAVSADAEDAGRREISSRARRSGVAVLTTGIASPDQLERALSGGSALLEGEHLLGAGTVRGRRPRGFEPSHLDLLAALVDVEFAPDVVEELLRRDLRLADRFLRFANAVSFGWRRPIASLRHAIVLVGEETMRRWLLLILLAVVAEGRPDQLVVTAAIRARFCETAGVIAGLGGRRLDLFMTGMFSVLDRLLGLPLEEALPGLPLGDDCRAALLDHLPPIGPVLAAVLAYERGDWAAADAAAAGFSLTAAQLAPAYLDAVAWAGETTDRAR